MTAHSYQPSQMQNEIPLPYYLQQHEITRNQLSNFSQMPKCSRIITNDNESIPYGWIINNIKQTFNGFHRNRP